MKKLNRATKLTALVAALLMTALSFQACATLDPGADAIAVRAEQTYQASSDAAEFLFAFEDTHEAVLEQKIPGFHKAVEKMRVQYRTRMPQLLQAIENYKATRDEGVLAVAVALVQQLLADLYSATAATGGV